MEESANFGELKAKAHQWTYSEEELLLNKLKSFTSTFEKKCTTLSSNLSNFSKNLELTNIDYYSTMHSLQILSLQKFVENVIDTNDVKPIQDQPPEEAKQLTVEESQTQFLTKCQQTIHNSLSALPNRGIRNEDSQSTFEDNVSVASSKVLAGQMEKVFRSMRLPYINGTKEFNNFPNVGLILESERVQSEDIHIRNQSGSLPQENEEVIISSYNNNVPQQGGGGNIPIPPQMNFYNQPIQNQNQIQVDPNPKGIDNGKRIERYLQKNSNENIDNDNKVETEEFQQDPQELLKSQMVSRSKTVNQNKVLLSDNTNNQNKNKDSSLGFNPQLKRQNELPFNKNPNVQLRATQTFTQQPSVEARKGGISLDQFVKKDMFTEEEDEDNNNDKDDDDLQTQMLFRHSGTMRDPNKFAMQNQVIPKAKEELKQEKPMLSGNLFDMNEDNSKTISKLAQNKKRDTLLETKMSMQKIFGDDDEEEEESTESKVTSITEKTQTLAKKLHQMTSNPKQETKSTNNPKQNVDKQEPTMIKQNPVKQFNEKERDQINSTNQNRLPQTSTKPVVIKKTTFFEDEEDIGETKKPQAESPKKETTHSNIESKEQPKQVSVNPPKAKVSLFDKINPVQKQTKPEEKKKPNILLNNEEEETKEPIVSIQSASNSNKLIMPSKIKVDEVKKEEESKQKEVKKEEDKPSQENNPSQKMGFSIQDRIKNMNKEKNQRKESSEQPKDLKIDFGNRRKEIESMLSGRISATSNPFVSDNSQPRKKTEDEENQEEEQKDDDNKEKENADNILEEKPKEESSEQKETEKEQERIVVVQKKKPKKKAFAVSNENENEKESSKETKTNSIENNTTSKSNLNQLKSSVSSQDSKEKGRQTNPNAKPKEIKPEKEQEIESKRVILDQQQKPKMNMFSSEQLDENPTTSKPSLFTQERTTQKEIKVDKKLFTNIFDDDYNDNNEPIASSNQIAIKPKVNLQSSLTMKKPTIDKASKLKIIFDDD